MLIQKLNHLLLSSGSRWMAMDVDSVYARRRARSHKSQRVKWWKYARTGLQLIFIEIYCCFCCGAFFRFHSLHSLFQKAKIITRARADIFRSRTWVRCLRARCDIHSVGVCVWVHFLFIFRHRHHLSLYLSQPALPSHRTIHFFAVFIFPVRIRWRIHGKPNGRTGNRQQRGKRVERQFIENAQIHFMTLWITRLRLILNCLRRFFVFGSAPAPAHLGCLLHQFLQLAVDVAHLAINVSFKRTK